MKYPANANHQLKLVATKSSPLKRALARARDIPGRPCTEKATVMLINELL
jgi:hypothetical protein